jgi:molecular chaperone HscA
LGGDDIDHAIAENFLAERGHGSTSTALTEGEAKQALAAARVA